MKVLKISFQIIIVTCFSLLTINYLTAQPTTIEATGIIIENTSWTADTVKVTGNITVMDDITLTINPGTYVEFEGNYYLRVNGTLIAEGNAGDSIVFTVADTIGFHNSEYPNGGWSGIDFNNGEYGANGKMNDNDTSKIVCCIIQYVKGGYFFPEYAIEQYGAIYTEYFSNLIISRSLIKNCKTVQGGGAICCIANSNPIISNNFIQNNYAWEGGAIYIDHSNPLIEYNKIYNNISGIRGGGIKLTSYADPVIENNEFIENISYQYGGAIEMVRAKGIFKDNLFLNNHSLLDGGAICCLGVSNGKFINNRFINNRADGNGGAIMDEANGTEYIGNGIFNNEAHSGAGFYLSGSSPQIINNTIAFNKHDGIYLINSNPTILNTILWGNQRLSGTIQIFLGSIYCYPDIQFCTVQDGLNGIAGAIYKGIYLYNIEKDPMFKLEAPSAGFHPDALEFDWTLNPLSPCINSGINNIQVNSLPEFDINGNKRILYGTVDIGAFEIPITKIYFSGNVIKDTLLVADTIVVDGDIIIEDNFTLKIAPGCIVEMDSSYKILVYGTLISEGTDDSPIIYTVSDTSGFSGDDPLLGGWQGIRFNNQAIGGAMDDNDSSKIIHNVIQYVTNSSSGAVICEYFSKLIINNNIIRNNKVKSAGVVVKSSNISINNNLIENNKSITGAGGIYIGASNAILENNTIQLNSGMYGGGIRLTNSKCDIRNNIIHKNEASLHGGGIYCNETELTLVNNSISNNIGEGIILYDSRCTFFGNQICNNHTAGKGGGICSYGSDPLIIVNNTIVNNSSDDNGGGLYLNSYSNAIIYNTILYGNLYNETENQCHIDYQGIAKVYYCNIQKGLEGISGLLNTYGNIYDFDPFFVNPTINAGLIFNGLEPDYSLLSISNCIDKGTTVIPNIEFPNKDLSGKQRIHYNKIDLGAFENQDNAPIIIKHPQSGNLCSGKSVTLHASSSDTIARYQWYKNGEIIPSAQQDSLVLNSMTLIESGNYNCIVSNGHGSIETNTATIQVFVEPEILSQTTKTYVSPESKVSLNIYSSGSFPLTYKWIKDSFELQGRISPELVFEKMKLSNEGHYYCIVDNICGKVTTETIPLYVAPQICMVTVSTITGNNLVVWEKNSIAPLTAYNIYRESTAAGIYDLMGIVPYSSLSVFEDTTADPTKRAYIYKITGVDTSGYETDLDLCKPHKTIHLLVSTNPELKSTQLAWDKYYGFDYQTYTILRSSTKSNFIEVDAMPSTLNSWTDPEPVTGELYYRVAVKKPDPCFPSGFGKKADTGPYSHSMSNIEDNRLKEGENPPDTIMLTNNTINENNNYGMLIGRLRTRDLDTLDTHTYSLVNGEGDDDNVSFTILGDMLLAAEIFDYEMKNDYSIRIRCKDNANLFREEVFSIYINDVLETGIANHYSTGQIQVYPNPFNQTTTLLFNNPEGDNYTLFIMDLSGKVVRLVNYINISKYVLEREDLKEGFYFIELRGPKIYRGKIVIE